MNLISRLISTDLQQTLFFVKVAFLLVSAGFVCFLIFFLGKTKWLTFLLSNDLIEFFTLKLRGAKKIAKAWKKIQKMVTKGREEDYKWAIIKADDFLGVALKRLVLLYQARTFEERLNWLSEATFPNIEALKRAHQIRRKIEQEPSFSLTPAKAQEILSAYQQAFKELAIIR